MPWPRWIVWLVALVGLLAGCTAPLQTPSSPSASAAASAWADTNAMARGAIGEGGLVRVPLAALPTAWNPWHARGATTDAQRVRSPLSEGAFLFDAAGRPTPNPAFRAGVQGVHDPATTVTLALDARAVWSDGASITAADWVATWQALGGRDPADQMGSDQGWRGVADVRAGSSPYEVVVRFDGVQPDWSRPLAAGPARAESVRDAATFNSAWPEYRPGWFAGPFVLAHLDRGQGIVTLDRNPLWWGEPPLLDHVVFRTIQPEALAAAFQHNEFDWVELGSPVRLAQVTTIADATIRTAPGTRGRLLRLDTRGVLADAGLRTALLRAVDRAALARADLSDLTATPTLWANHLLLTNQPGYVDQAVATGLGRDQTAAARALSAAGWQLSDGRRVRDGQSLVLTMATPEGDAWARAEFDVLASLLADLGVTLASTTTAAADLVGETVAFDRYPLAAVGAPADPALAGLARQVESETDAVRRADLAAQLSRAMWSDAATIPLHQPPQVVATRNGLANLGARGFASVRWSDVGWER